MVQITDIIIYFIFTHNKMYKISFQYNNLPGVDLQECVSLHRLYVIAGQTYESGQREPPDDGQLI